jgi:hypothetical protein
LPMWCGLRKKCAKGQNTSGPTDQISRAADLFSPLRLTDTRALASDPPRPPPCPVLGGGNSNRQPQSFRCSTIPLAIMEAHKNYKDFVRYYWSNWRAQPQMADALISVVEKELERYPRVDIPLLPQNQHTTRT